MKINIDAPMKQKEIMDVLKASTNPKYEYLGHPNGMFTSIQYEVTSDDVQDLVSYTKNLIKSQEFGKAIALRVLEDGKNW